MKTHQHRSEHEIYEETLERLFLGVGELATRQYEDEVQISIFNRLSSVLSDFYSKVDILHGQRKESALNTISSLQYVFNRLGLVYLYSLHYRKELFKKNEALMKATETINELTTRIKQLEAMNEC